MMPILIGEETYYDDDDGGAGGGYNQNEHERHPGSPDTFFYPSQSQSQSQVQSPAQAYAQSYAQSHKQPSHNIQSPREDQDRQPLTSDSAHTPPSVQRRSIQRPSQMNHTSPMFKRTAGTGNSNANANSVNTKDNNHIKDINNKHQRAQSLNALPQKTLVHLLQIKEEETRRAKKMLRSALVQLELEVGRGEVLEGRVRDLEEKVEREKVERERFERDGGLGVKALKGVLDEQRRAGGGEQVEGLKLKLSNTERELQRMKEDCRALQIERDDSDRALVRARTLAREMKEKAILIQAREKGRQEGFEEGLRQGRLLGQSNEESSSGEASGSGGRERARTRERSTNNKDSSRRNHTDTNPSSLEAEATIAAVRANAERDNLRVQLELKAMEGKLDTERLKMRDVVREKVHLEKMVKEERDGRAERERERERERVEERAEREREREKEKQARAERERAKESERENEKDALKRQVEKERWEKEKMERDFEKKLAEAEENRIKDKEKFEKQLKETVAPPPPAQPLPYLSMARPPTDPSTQVPRTSSSGSYRRPKNRRSSVDSSTSQASSIPFDILQLPHGERERNGGGGGGGGDLSVILEDVSVRGVSPSVANSASGSATAAAPPSWLTNPPVDYGKVQNDGRGGHDSRWPQEPTNNNNGGGGPYPPYNPHHQNQHDYNQGDYLRDNNPQSLRRSTGSTGSYEFVVVPPSRPESGIGDGDPGSYNTHNAPNNNNTNTGNPTDNRFLSPAHQTTPLPQTQTQTQTYGRPESPAAKPVIPRFPVPQVQQQQHYHPQYDNNTSGIPTQPNSPVNITGTIGVNQGLPAGFVAQSITDATGRSTPLVHGTGVGGGMGFIPPGIGGGGGGGGGVYPPPSRSGTPNNQWNNNPVIPPASSGPYGNPIALEREKKRNEEAALSARPPPPLSRSQSPVGGAEWSAPLAVLHPPIFPVTGTQQPFQQPPIGGSWGGGGGASPSTVKRPFEYSPASSTRPVIPGQTSTLGGGGGGGSGGTWGIPTASSFAGAGGMTPRSRNQDLAPVIPSQTDGGAGAGWGTPAAMGFTGAGMTPRTRDQDFPPVIPGQMGSGTPRHAAGGFPGVGMTPRPRDQDLPPVMPSPTGGGAGSGWGGAAGGFGAGISPGPRNRDLPTGGGGSGSPYQPSFSIYGPPSPSINANTSAGGYQPRSSSPFPIHSSSPYVDEEIDGDREDDPITAVTEQNTKMNAGGINLNSGLDSNMGNVGGGRGGKKGKGGKSRKR